MRGDEQQNVLTLSISEGRLLTWPRIITDPVHLKKEDPGCHRRSGLCFFGRSVWDNTKNPLF